MIQEVLYAKLHNITLGRIYPLIAPADVVKPYIVYTRIPSETENTIDEEPGLFNTRLQIDTYHTTYQNALIVAAQVRNEMTTLQYKNIHVYEQDFYDTDSNLYRVMMEYSIWHP